MGPIILFTDFGWSGPYVGQMHGAVAAVAPAARVIDLMHCAAPFHPRAGAYLLASLVPEFPPGSIFVAVVDPGVGTERRGLVLRAGARWVVGPDNGLLEVVAAQTPGWECWEITWRAARTAPTFHGRDLFAPMAGALVRGTWRHRVRPLPWAPRAAPDLWEVVFIDGFGNAVTGIRRTRLGGDVSLGCRQGRFAPGRTFADAQPGQPLWYENSNGLAELAVNQGSAADRYRLATGDPVRSEDP